MPLEESTLLNQTGTPSLVPRTKELSSSSWISELHCRYLRVTYIKEKFIVYMLVYVDDIVITGNSSTLLQDFIVRLSTRFSLKEPTDLAYFLGIEATKTSQGLHLMQRKYILDLLQRTNMLDANTITTPMASSPKLSIRTGTQLEDPHEYRRVIGSLQYLAFTRPDIAYSVNRLS